MVNLPLTSLSAVSMIPSTSSADTPISNNGTIVSTARGLSLGGDRGPARDKNRKQRGGRGRRERERGGGRGAGEGGGEV